MGRAFVFQLSRQLNKKVLRLLCMRVYARVSASAAEQSGSRTSPTSHTMRVFCDSRPYAPRVVRFSVRLMRVAARQHLHHSASWCVFRLLNMQSWTLNGDAFSL
jgi:hypothetical protein